MRDRGRHVALVFAAGWTALATGLAGCAGVNPTGLMGGQVQCAEGPRQTLDCRGALRQYARDLKADLGRIQVGLGVTVAKLTEADALSSDLIQHHYQTCALYNACLVTRQEYVARTQQLQEIQLEVRKVVGPGFGQQEQNIQINPPQGGVPPHGVRAEAETESEPPSAQRQDRAEAILGVLRSGVQLVASSSASAGEGGGSPSQVRPRPPARRPPAGPSAGPAAQADLDANLRGLLTGLRGDVARQSAPGPAGTVVGNFTEEGKPWGSPLGALLQERVARMVEGGEFFRPAAAPTRGLTARQVAAAGDPNEPKTLARLHGSDLVITGSYRPGADAVRLSLAAVDSRGTPVGRAAGEIPRRSIPEVVAATPPNAADAGRVLDSLGQLGPPSQGDARVQVTTSRPGAGASFRLGEEIRYFVTSTADGYLYLFHVDADRAVLRIFPNEHQPDARVAAGAAVEVPAPGAPFRFEASPPFGLETTFAIVTATPLSEADFQGVEAGFARPKQDVPTLLGSRGIAVRPAGASGSGAAAPQLVWGSVTVLIRP